MTKLLSSSFLFFLSLFANAQERISADRPDQTEGATLTPPHYFQAEFGFGAINYGLDNFDVISPQALFKYGLCKKFEVQVLDQFISSHEQTFSLTKRTTGFTPVIVGFRAAICEEKKFIPKTSIIVRLGIPPFSSKDFRPDHPPLTIILPMEKTLTEHIGISTNVGITWDGFSSKQSWFYSLSSGFDICKKWDAFAEIFGSAMKNEMAQNSIDIGLGFYITNDIKLDTYIGIGINKATANNFFGAGISMRLH